VVLANGGAHGGIGEEIGDPFPVHLARGLLDRNSRRLVCEFVFWM
jgi:hypothetical protein